MGSLWVNINNFWSKAPQPLSDLKLCTATSKNKKQRRREEQEGFVNDDSDLGDWRREEVSGNESGAGPANVEASLDKIRRKRKEKERRRKREKTRESRLRSGSESGGDESVPKAKRTKKWRSPSPNLSSKQKMKASSSLRKAQYEGTIPYSKVNNRSCL
uniref:Uncharacterized protein n=1 Tax=Romanomermis culicivorax TaxID=13658 RepID=A0A915HWU0_ROMCU